MKLLLQNKDKMNRPLSGHDLQKDFRQKIEYDSFKDYGKMLKIRRLQGEKQTFEAVLF